MLTRSIEVKIGDRLAQVRRARKLSQKQLAELSGMTYWGISMIERNARDPGFRTVQRLARALDMPLPEFVAPVDEEIAS
jgi:transcriptional regulator with XRE-family HTH domain